MFSFSQNPPLKPYQLLAIQLRYEGYTSEGIANELKRRLNLKYTTETVRWWFKKDGPLRAAYDNFAEKQNEILITDMHRTFIRKARSAQRVMLQAMEGKATMTQFITAKSWIDRALGKI